jgi:putative transposase
MARVVVPGMPHHITQRGNRRETVFFSDADRRRFLGLLSEYADRGGLELLAYCLMDNHLHLVAVPETEASLAVVLKPVNLLYARYLNQRKGWCGRLWQERYYSCPMDRNRTLIAARYVEQNPVRAGLAKRAEEYAWSSAAGHTGKRVDPLLSDQHGWLTGIGDWTEWLRGTDDESDLAELRLRTTTGRPFGSAEFISKLAAQTGRALAPRPRGRPKRTPTTDK